MVDLMAVGLPWLVDPMVNLSSSNGGLIHVDCFANGGWLIPVVDDCGRGSKESM